MSIMTINDNQKIDISTESKQEDNIDKANTVVINNIVQTDNDTKITESTVPMQHTTK